MVVECPCADLRRGTQTCGSDGTYGSCNCQGNTDGGAGGTGGVAGSTGGTGGLAGSSGGIGGIAGGLGGTGGVAGAAGPAAGTGGGGAGGRGGSAGTGGRGGSGGAIAGTGGGGIAGTGAAGSAGTGSGGMAGAAAGTGGAGGGWTGACKGLAWSGDFDGDGLYDCAIDVPGTTTSLRGIEFHKGLGPTTFSASFASVGVMTADALPSGHTAFATMDLTGDGRADIVEECSTSLSGTPFSGPVLLLLVGNADGTFSGPPKDYLLSPLSPRPTSLPGFRTYRGGDFDNDGRADLVITVREGTEYSGYAKLDTLSARMSTGGRNDLLIRYSTEAINVGTNGRLIVSGDGDFDGDGERDVVAVLDFIPLVSANRRTNVVIAPGNGDGTFGNSVAVPGTNGAQSGQVMDANTDGKLDLLVTFETGDGGPAMQTFYGDGAGNFSTTAP
jgi:hypothetical protein